MEDNDIVELYWQRSQQAIGETQSKYGRYLYRIAENFLGCHEDAEESVNDTYLGAWNSMPPHRPERLSTFLGKLTRYSSLMRLRSAARGKRGGGEVSVALEELSECIPSRDDTELEVEKRELAVVLNAFVKELSRPEREVFTARYWYTASVKEICISFGFGESKVKSMLFRTRKKLKKYLEKEGI